MASAKCWKVSTSLLESLIDNADSQGNCYLEVYAASSDKIDDCELYLKTGTTTWQDSIPIIPPTIPPAI